MAAVGDVYAGRVGLLRSESGRLLEYFRGLSAGDWGRPSACAAWSNADVAAHLIMAVDMFAGNIGRGLRGDCSPPEGMGPPQETDLAGRMAANAVRAVSVREGLGDLLVAVFGEQCRRLDDVLSGAGPGDWDKPCYHPAAMLTVGRYVDLRLTELAVHEWDIRSGLEGSEVGLPDAALPAALGLLPGFVVGRLFQPGAGIERAARFRFGLADGGVYDVVAGGGELRMEARGEGAADVVFSCDASTFVLLAYGRLGVDAAVAAGRMGVAGDRGLASRF